MGSPNPDPLVGFHGTREGKTVLAEGLKPRTRIPGGCEHICIAAEPHVAANFGEVFVVDLRGLDARFFQGEARFHEPIPPRRLRPLGWQPEPSWDGWSDPMLRFQHEACR